MKKIRIIPRLDIKGPNLVKGIHLEGLRVLGKPENFAKYYYENGADELFFQDVVASLYERNSLQNVISATAKQAFIPLTVGGGLRTIEDINDVLRAGADKVAINTAAIKDPLLIKRAAEKFGSSTIVVAIEAIRQPNGQYLAYTDNGREETGKNVFEWAQQIEELGAGELLITSVDREGTGEGFDLELISGICDIVNIPVIAHGGCGKPQDVSKLLDVADLAGIAIASIFHYGVIANKNVIENFDAEGNTRFIDSGNTYKKITPFTIPDVKRELALKGYPVRN